MRSDKPVQTTGQHSNRRHSYYKSTILGGLGLILIVVFLYFPSTRSGFIWDDDNYVSDNECLTSVSGLKRIWTDLKANKQYYPLVFTSFWIERQLFGQRAFYYHLGNILLHGLNAFLLWILLRRLNAPGAGLCAIIFAVHPINVETVAWVSERKNILSALFCFLSLLSFPCFFFPDENARVASLPRGNSRFSGQYVLSLLFFVCALLSKSVAGVLPVVIVILLWWKDRPIHRKIVGALLPFFILSGLAAVNTIALEKWQVGAHGPPWALDFLERCLIAGRALWFYAYKILWPHEFIFIYPRWRIDVEAVWQYLFPLTFILLLIVLWRWREKIGKAPLAAVLAYAVVIFPALCFIDFFPMRYSFVADHFQYFSGIALIVLIVGVVARMYTFHGAILKNFLRGLGFVTILFLSARTWQEQEKFRSLETLWADTIHKNPNCWMAYVHMGVLKAKQGDIHAAETCFSKSLSIADNYESHINLGYLRETQGDYEAAQGHYESAVMELDSLGYKQGALRVYKDLAEVSLKRHDYRKAIKYFSILAREKPDQPDIQYFMGMCYYALGETQQAIRCFQSTLFIQPDYQKARAALSAILSTGTRRRGEQKRGR